jgi:hypothetical protein
MYLGEELKGDKLCDSIGQLFQQYRRQRPEYPHTLLHNSLNTSLERAFIEPS